MRLTTRFLHAAALCAALTAVTPALADNKKVVVSQAFQSMVYLPFYVAMEEGFFTKQGLDVTKQSAGAPSVALSAVISKSAQFSSMGPNWRRLPPPKALPLCHGQCRHGAAVGSLRRRISNTAASRT